VAPVASIKGSGEQKQKMMRMTEMTEREKFGRESQGNYPIGRLRVSLRVLFTRDVVKSAADGSSSVISHAASLTPPPSQPSSLIPHRSSLIRPAGMIRLDRRAADARGCRFPKLDQYRPISKGGLYGKLIFTIRFVS
jgi:hypothetical protein